jgi:hypothetical protein
LDSDLEEFFRNPGGKGTSRVLNELQDFRGSSIGRAEQGLPVGSGGGGEGYQVFDSNVADFRAGLV